MNIIRSIVTLFLLLTTSTVSAQVYPVQVAVSTTPPYFNYLSHFGDQNNHLLIIATLTDFNSPPINARLRIRIEGAGYTLQTRQDIPVGNVYPLTAGVPVFIQGDELLPLLSQNNLAVVSGNVNLNNLPEGFTSICVDVVENGTGGAVLATNNCTSFFLQLMQPPQPQLPFCNSIADTTSLFQNFQWSAPQNYVPSIGTELNYTFSLYEWIDTTNFNIFQTGQGLVYSAQTASTLIQVSNFDVTFQKGRKYVWRVKAQLTNNGLPVQMITQEGLSQPCSFYYGKPTSIEESLADGLTINLTTEALATRKGRALWSVTDATPNEGLSGYTSYIVDYRRKPAEGETYNYPWNTDTVNQLQLPIYQLEPEKTYQVRVSGVAGSYTSPRTPISEFTTPSARDYACGEGDLPYVSPNFQPLASAHMGDVLQIGQFPLMVTDIHPLTAEGRFSGHGQIPHDFIGGAKVKVRFDNILIDRDYTVREGIAYAMTDGAEDWLNGHYLDNAQNDTVNGVIESGGFINDTTVFVVVNGDTLTYVFEGNYPIVIYGNNNVAYQFWPDGTMVITTWGTTLSNDTLNATKNLYASFKAIEGSEKLFDRKEYDHLASNYELIQCAENFNYWVPNTAKGVTGTTQVKATVHVNTVGYTPSNMHFEVKGGYTTVPHTVINDTTFLLTLPAKSYSYQVYALYDEFKIGKLNVINYDSVRRKVRIVPLVPMGNLSVSSINQGLANQFKASRIGFDVTIDSLYATTEFNAQTIFASPDANLMQKYTTQMRALRTAYTTDRETNNDEYLIFVVPSFDNSAIDGYMVRGKALGFVTASTTSNANNFVQTLAHELGHGMGGLEHSWGSNPSFKGATSNLMDYGSSNTKTLTRLQWDAMHDSPTVLTLFDDEEDFAMVSSTLGNRALLANLTVTSTEYVAHDFIGESDLFKTSKDALFKFTASQIQQIQGVYLYDQSIIGLKGTNNHYYRLHYHIEKQPVDLANNIYVVFDKGTITFADIELPRDSSVFTDTEGQTCKSFSALPDDILIGKDQYVKCADSLRFIYNGSNGTPSSKYVICSEGAFDCSSYQSNIFTNVGASAMQINRSTKACIKNYSSADLIHFIDIFADEIDNLSQTVNYNYVNYENIGSGYSSNCFGGHACADEFDVGRAFVKVFDASEGKTEVLDHITTLLKNNNYKLLRQALVRFEFQSVGYPMVDLASSILSSKSENFIKHTTPTQIFGETIQVPNEFKTFIITNNGNTLNSTNALEANILGVYNETVFLSDQGHVVLNENYNYRRVYQEFDSRYIVNYQSPGAMLFAETHVVDTNERFDQETRDPFQPTLFLFNDQFNALAIEKDKHYLRPAIWGIVAKKLIQDHEDGEFWRTFGNACTVSAAVIAAPFSGGGTLAFLAVGSTVATADEYYRGIQNNQSLAEYQADSTYRNYWNQFYTVVQIVDGVVGGAQLAILAGNGILRVINSVDDISEIIQDIGFAQYVSRTGKAIYSTFVTACKNGVSQADNWITQRTTFWNDWIVQCFPDKNWGSTTFITKGNDYNAFKNVNTSIYNDMKALNPNEIKLQEFIEAGSTTPVKVVISQGDEFYKIVPKGNNINGPSAYYMDEAQLNIIRANPQKLEQLLGLPLGSVDAEYDVFKITYQGNNGYVFKSTVASTEQYANVTPTIKYTTTGGGTQTLILDNGVTSKWLKGTTPIESISPTQLPQIGN